MAQWVVLQVDGQTYGVPVGSVVEVLRLVALTPMPDAPGWLLGILNLRGRGVMVVDLRRRLGLTVREPGLDDVILVARVEDRDIGLLVDEVTEVLELTSDLFAPPDRMAGAGHALSAIAHVGDRTILALDLARLLAA